MFAKSKYVARRNRLKEKLNDGLLVFMGNDYVGMNYKHNTYRFRQDSSFLYFFGIDQEGLCGIIDLDEGKEFVFGDELSLDDIVWTGPQKSIKDKAAEVGVDETRKRKEATVYIQKALHQGRKIHLLPPYRDANKIYLAEALDTNISGLSHYVSEVFIDAVISLRSIKEEAEIVQMEEALATTYHMHIAAMKHARAGLKEYDLTAKVHGEALAGGGDLAYPIILSVDGQTLHNHYHGNELKEGQLVLGDFGAENVMHYAGDITRTFPVSKRFSEKQKDIYEIVLAAEDSVIDAVKPGVKYMDMHLHASRIILDGLKGLGLVKGSVEDALAAGAYGLFFPHGLGHMIGLDVHDMEDLGEDRVGYSDGLERSSLFGLRSLRLGKELEEGHVITVEPGIYFIPELITQWRSEGRFKDFIAYERLDEYFDFSGIRIEDDVLITAKGARVLGPHIPKEISEIESLRD